jgi:hypothetical protein
VEANAGPAIRKRLELPGTDERPVMQDFKDGFTKDSFTDMDQLPGHKAGPWRGSVSRVQADSAHTA